MRVFLQSRPLLTAAAAAMLMVFGSSCQVQKALDSVNGMGDKLDATNEQMKGMGDSLDKTKSAIHLQVLQSALTEMHKKENWGALSPVPFGLLAPAKAFAEEATANELMDFFALTLNEISESKLSLFTDPLTGDQKPYVAGSAEYNDIRVEKVAKYMSLQAVAGFVPDDVVTEIVRTQIRGTDEAKSKNHARTALTFLALRHQFIHDVLLHASLMDKGLTNIGQVEEAIEYNRKIDAIEKLDLSHPIESDVKVTLNVKKDDGTSTEVLDFSGPIDRTQAATDWRNLLDALAPMKNEVSPTGTHMDTSAETLRGDQQRALRADDFIRSVLGVTGAH